MECVNLQAAPINSTWFCKNCELTQRKTSQPAQHPPNSRPPTHASLLPLSLAPTTGLGMDLDLPPSQGQGMSVLDEMNRLDRDGKTQNELKEGDGCVIM